MTLVLKNISKSYGSQKVLNSVNLELHKGQIIGLLGRNGVGKTTLLKILAGILDADGGDLPMLEDLKIGYLSEKAVLYTNMYVREYLEFVSKIHVDYNANRINDIIHELGLDDVLIKKIGQLSKGYMQRVAIAAVLVHDPDLLILDEPVNGLDPFQIRMYRDLIKKISRDKYVILSSHLLQEIEAICDRIAVLQEGRITIERALNSSNAEHRMNELYVRTSIPFEADRLSQLKFISSVQLIDKLSCRIQMKDTDTNRAILFDALVTNENRILEIRSLYPSLEDLFNE